MCRVQRITQCPVHLQKAYSHLGYKSGSLPNTEKACAEVISMPLFPEMRREQVVYVAETLAEVVEELTPVESISQLPQHLVRAVAEPLPGVGYRVACPAPIPFVVFIPRIW